MTATSRRSGGPWLEAETIAVWVAVAGVVLIGGTVTAAAHLGAHLDGRGQHLPANPFELVLGLARGAVAWPDAATGVLVALAAALLVLTAAATAGMSRVRGRRPRVDRAARRMGRGRDVAALTGKGAAAAAARLGVAGSPGVPIGRTVAGGRTLYQGFEDVSVDIWGPRTGKTTSRAVPAILEAPGAVVATSNKRDLVDATRGPRSQVGEVWVFDPQGLVGEEPTWWWDPLSYVTDEVKAAILADVFTSAARPAGARVDAYFDSAGQDLLAGLLLAAALDRRPITQVYLWLTDPTDDEPADILRRHDYPLPAAAVADVVNAPEKQRAGVYGTAKQTAACLSYRAAGRWVNPAGPGDERRRFDPHAFVGSGSTLYSLSKEGRGSTGALVAALTVAVTEAAEDLAARSSGGRLPVPMLAVLDEAANVCRWRELPNVYSHYGSRGICMMTILQSWSQGAEVWGRDGMRKLWSSANIRVYGGGASEAEFLGELSQLVGDYDLDTTSITRGRGGRSISHATRRERVLEVADLASLARGRAVVFASGAPATLVQTLPWMTGPHADAVNASIRAHDPVADDTLAQTTTSLRADQDASGDAAAGGLR